MTQPTPTFPSSKGAVWGVAALLTITFLAGVFAANFNHRAVDITPYLRGKVHDDSVENGGNSIATVAKTDSTWLVKYHLRPRFAFPYAGIDFNFDSSLPVGLDDWSRFHQIRLRVRYLHPGALPIRCWITSERVHGKDTLQAPNEVQFQPTSQWTTTALDWSILRIPSWWIAQSNIAPNEQRVNLERVRKLQFQTPDLHLPNDSGIIEISKVHLEGPWVSPTRLMMGIQILWVGWGILFLIFGWRSWRARALIASTRADHAEELVQAKTDFVATMSHEIRTPLNGVIVPAQMLQESPLDAEQLDHVQTILESANHLLGILQNALDFSKLEAGKLELEQVPLSPQRALESVRRIFEPKASEKSVKLLTDFDAELPEGILGDPLRLRQVLMNLVSNALKFTEQGTITLEAKKVRRFGMKSAEPRLRFAVSDTGIGMDPAACKRLFQKYTQLEKSTSRKYGGTGLGLAISQGLVEAMGGRIEVASTLGKGSSFFFSIPFQPTELITEHETETIPVFLTSSFQVLVVDDNRVNRKVAKAMLSKLGCQVVVASSGLEAIALLETQKFDLILMDCHMPDMNGFEASLAIRSWKDDPQELCRQAAQTPIIALTADVLPDIHKRCEMAKMDGVLPKPFRQELMAKEIARWMNSPRGESPFTRLADPSRNASETNP